MGFLKIFSHINGPSQLDTTEYGDTWPAAMDKINAMFKELYGHLTQGVPIAAEIEHIDDAARKAILDVRDEIAILQIKLDAIQITVDNKLHAPFQPVGASATPGAVPRITPSDAVLTSAVANALNVPSA